MLLTDLILLRFIRKSSYTSPVLYSLLSLIGGSVAICFALFISRFFDEIPNRNLAVHGLAWHGIFFLLASALIMFTQRRRDGKRRRFMPIGTLCVGSILFILAADALLIEPTALVIKEITIPTAKISKPITIVFCADIQADRVRNYERWTLQKIKEQNPDLILFGGDYVQGNNAQKDYYQTKVIERKEKNLHLIQNMNQLFKDADLQAPLGIFAVQGNKEHFLPWRQMFTGTTIIPQKTTNTRQIGEIRVSFLSIGRSRMKYPVSDKEHDKSFRIIVGHMPLFALAEQDADLLLAGHTHGGQVQIPFYGPIMTNADDLPRGWASGMTTLPNGSTLIVSNGSGLQRQPDPVIRFFCRPDFWVIRLVPL